MLDQIRRCVRCGACRAVCPSFEVMGWESFNTRGRMMIIKRMLEERDGSWALDSIGTCTTCALCTQMCPAGVKSSKLIEDARRVLASRDIIGEWQRTIRDNISKTGNSLGESRGKREWLSLLGSRAFKEIKDRAESVYFAGCMASYRYPETAARTFEILSGFGVALLPAEQCCGSPLLRTGLDASGCMEENLRQIREMDVDVVITGCAGCYTTLKNDYPGVNVVSVAEFLADRISEIEIRPLDITVAYHDPCHLGRMNGIFEPPRKVIKEICELEEMEKNRELARCCGGGGGVRAGYRDISLKIARRRLADAPPEVNYIVTACPMCVRNLNEAGGYGKIIDLVDLVAIAARG